MHTIDGLPSHILPNPSEVVCWGVWAGGGHLSPFQTKAVRTGVRHPPVGFILSAAMAMITPILACTDWEEYQRLRVILRQHQNAAVKTISGFTFRKCAKTFGMLDGNKLMLESESELTILMDFCIYSHRQKRTLMEKYLAKLPPTDDADEKVVREAMSQSRYSMYRIEKIIQGSGLHVHDLVRGNRLFLVDETLSKTLKTGALLGGRLIPLPGYWITTGACFPLSEEVVEDVEEVFLRALKMTEGDVSSLSAEAEEELAAVVIGAAMEDGTTSMVDYQ